MPWLWRWPAGPRPGAALCSLIMVVITLSTGCGAEEASAPLPPPPAQVTVEMSEYRYEYDPEIPAGRVVFRFTNVGTVDHELGLWPLEEDFPPIDVQLHGSTRRFLTPFARSEVVRPGATGTFAVDLVSGQRYALICFLRGPQGQEHEQLGMNSEFRAR